MPSKGTEHRAIRIDSDLWERVKAKAKADGVTVSDLIRDLLRKWLQDG
jgi:predicted DNA binding CopG/RHH family protein